MLPALFVDTSCLGCFQFPHRYRQTSPAPPQKLSASLLLCFLCVEINPAPSSYRLLAHYSVSWKMAFPDHLMDIGLPFDDAYALAVRMRASG